MPTPIVKYLEGYVFEASQLPAGSQVSARLSNRIVDASENLVIEADEVLSDALDDIGRWVLALRPNNVPGDAPLNTNWLITEPSGHSEFVFIPYDTPGGDTPEDALDYVNFILLPEDLDPPTSGDLQDQIDVHSAELTYLRDAVDAMNSMDSAALEALTPAQETDLVDAAGASSAEATSSTPGLMPAGHWSKVEALDLARLVLLDAAAGGIVIPTRTAGDYTGTITSGEARLWVSPTDGQAKIRAGTSTSALAPGLDSPSFRASADITVTSTTPQTIATFPVAANATYFIDGRLDYRAEGAKGILTRFAGTPSGATLLWNGIGLDELVVGGAGGTGSLDARRRTGTQALVFAGQGTTTGEEREMTGVIRGILVTGATAGTISWQLAHGASGTTTNPTALAGTSMVFERYG